MFSSTRFGGNAHNDGQNDAGSPSDRDYTQCADLVKKHLLTQLVLGLDEDTIWDSKSFKSYKQSALLEEDQFSTYPLSIDEDQDEKTQKKKECRERCRNKLEEALPELLSACNTQLVEIVEGETVAKYMAASFEDEVGRETVRQLLVPEARNSYEEIIDYRDIYGDVDFNETEKLCRERAEKEAELRVARLRRLKRLLKLGELRADRLGGTAKRFSKAGAASINRGDIQKAGFFFSEARKAADAALGIYGELEVLRVGQIKKINETTRRKIVECEMELETSAVSPYFRSVNVDFMTSAYFLERKDNVVIDEASDRRLKMMRDAMILLLGNIVVLGFVSFSMLCSMASPRPGPRVPVFEQEDLPAVVQNLGGEGSVLSAVVLYMFSLAWRIFNFV